MGAVVTLYTRRGNLWMPTFQELRGGVNLLVSTMVAWPWRHWRADLTQTCSALNRLCEPQKMQPVRLRSATALAGWSCHEST